MFLLSNLNKSSKNGWTYLSCDFKVTEIKSPFKEDKLWVAVEEKNADMLTDEVYDPFVLVPLFLGMYYGQDVHIQGKISPRLYHNVNHYLMNIFDRFSDKTKPVKFIVDGFQKVEQIAGGGQLIGTGISCGIDSLLTIYENFIQEEDPNFKINSLFFVNCGTHGDYLDKSSHKKFTDRVHLNGEAAKELGLPMYVIDSNFHSFAYQIGEQRFVYLAIYSCILSMQKYVKRYYTSSNYSYDEIMEFTNLSYDYDIAEYCESFMPHLVSTECFELVIDGCQYTRGEKLEKISEWDFAQKHLNVCIHPLEGGYNCSCCQKCYWTLIPLEAMGKLNKFSSVFDLNVYRKKAYRGKWRFMALYGKAGMETSVVRYAKKNHLRMPPKNLAKIAFVLSRPIKRIQRKRARKTADK